MNIITYIPANLDNKWVNPHVRRSSTMLCGMEEDIVFYEHYYKVHKARRMFATAVISARCEIDESHMSTAGRAHGTVISLMTSSHRTRETLFAQ